MRYYAMLLTITGLFLLMTATEASADCGKCEAGGEQWKEAGGGKGKCEGGGKHWKEAGGCSGCTFGPKMLSKFNLSTEQQAKVNALQDKMDKDNKPTIKKLDALRAGMQKLWLADKPSEKFILKQQAKMAPHREKLRKRRVRFKLDVFALLNPEQKAQFKEHVKSRKGKAGKGSGRQAKCGRD
jgi:Spy/CpxP family protein refolding chaperone